MAAVATVGNGSAAGGAEGGGGPGTHHGAVGTKAAFAAEADELSWDAICEALRLTEKDTGHV